jgi:type II secretory pathway component PulF
MIFFIKKLDLNDKKISYFDSFSDIEEAIEFIEKEGAIPLYITPVPKIISPILSFFLKPKIKKENIIEIIENFYLIIKSGIPIQTAIEDMIKENNNKFIKKMLKNISIKLQKGRSFSESLESYTKYFSKFIISLIKIGEQTGNLELTLKNGAEFLKNIENLKKQIKQAMIYPSFAFFAIIFSMSIWLFYVLPKIIDFFKQLNIKLPFITVAVMNFAEFIQNYFFYLIVVFIILLIVFIYSLKYKKVKYKFDKFLLKTPLIKNFIIYFNSAFFAEYIKLTISSGLPILEGLKTLKENTSNLIFKEAIEKIIENIQKGYSISEAIKEAKLYPLFMERMITIGEDTGELENQLNLISQYYHSKINYLAQNLSKFIEPALLILLAVFITIIMLSIFGPLYSLIGNIK